MFDLILLVIFSYSLYRLAESHRIRPWRWIFSFSALVLSTLGTVAWIIFKIYGPTLTKDMDAANRTALLMEPFLLLFQLVVFLFLRTRMLKYVHALDELDKLENTPPTPPTPKKEDKDLSYFR
ncbi:MAG: hypothetical protein JST76_09810 [Bacteroidetes bacterium]|nr:hypothetical protein [Bacteroidota bacterium]